jgi:hypothetical protein
VAHPWSRHNKSSGVRDGVTMYMACMAWPSIVNVSQPTWVDLALQSLDQASFWLDLYHWVSLWHTSRDVDHGCAYGEVHLWAFWQQWHHIKLLATGTRGNRTTSTATAVPGCVIKSSACSLVWLLIASSPSTPCHHTGPFDLLYSDITLFIVTPRATLWFVGKCQAVHPYA